MSEQNQQVQGGHLIQIAINEIVIGFGRSSNVSQDFGVDGVYSLGSIAPHEHVPMRWSAQVTLDSFVLNANSLDPQTLQLFDMIAQGHEELKRQVSFNLTVLSGPNDGQELYTLLQCTPTNFSMSFQANQFSGQNATFVAKAMRRGPAFQFRGDDASGLGAEFI